MSLTAVPTLVVASVLVRTRCPVCDGPLTVEGRAPVQAPPGYGCSCCGANVLPLVDMPPTSPPVPPVPVYAPLPQAAAPVPVVAPIAQAPVSWVCERCGASMYSGSMCVQCGRERTAPAPKPAPATPAPKDRAPQAAPRLVTFKRMAPCQCYSCKGEIAAGSDCTLDARGRMLHPACTGSRKAPAAPAPAPKPAPEVVTYWYSNVQYSKHVDAYLRAEVARKTGTPNPVPQSKPAPAPKPAPVAPIAKPAAPKPAPALVAIPEAPKVTGPAGSFNAHLDGAEFKRALAQCVALAPRKSTTPYCECINMRHVDGRTVMQATNLDTWLAVEVNSKGSGQGSTCVNAATLKATVGKGKPATVAVEYSAEGTLSIAGAKLATLPGAEYPKAPQLSGASLEPADALGEMLRRVRDAVATDESRYHLSGVMLGNRDGHAVAVATDGHRLHVVEREGMRWPWTQDVILCRSGVEVIVRACDGRTGTPRVGLDTDRKWLHVRMQGIAVAARLQDAQFPPYEMVVPKDHDGRMTVLRADLEAALVDCAKFTKGNVPFTKWAAGPDGTLTITAEDPDRGTIKREVVCEANREIAIGLNAAYVVDALAACDVECVTVEYQGELDPVVVRPERTRTTMGVIMPSRIK